jgi:hypothetical protein
VRRARRSKSGRTAPSRRTLARSHSRSRGVKAERQQRELAGAKLSAEELKQLERLTRADRLRQQAEGLRQNAQQGQAIPRCRRVEQMRNATSDLRRQDTAAAAQKGERAAEQLRSLERQARAGSVDGKQRAASELQIEAQQIADAQRRIAAETERLEREGGTNAEARRRTANEKERLAGRVDELQRSAKQEGQADAARELERGQVGQRMRETAKQLRDGSQPTSSNEQQIARTLDQVVDKLGGSGNAERQRLSEELNQTRDIRDRLNRLEQQMRAAEAKQKAGRGTDVPAGGRSAEADARSAKAAGSAAHGAARLQRAAQSAATRATRWQRRDT